MNIHTLVQYIDISNKLLGPEDSVNSPLYTFLGNPEEESTVLSTNLDLCVDPLFWSVPNAKIRVYVCMYRRTRLVIPVCSKVRDLFPVEYLSFFMEKNERREYSFPSFSYTCNETDADTDENGLKSACIDHILSVRALEQKGLANHMGARSEYEEFPRAPTASPLEYFTISERYDVSHENHTNIDTGYKGFIEDKKKVFVFFDSDKFDTFFRTKESDNVRETWAIVDEILNKKKIIDVDIDPIIIRMFVKNPIAWNIKYDGHNVDYPRQMYALIPTNLDDIETTQEYATETYPSNGKTLSHMSMALPYSYSDIFSDRYLFTKEPVKYSAREAEPEAQAVRSRIKRYACFIYNPRTILDRTYPPHRDCIKKYPNNTIENIRLEAEDDEMAEDIRETPCIVFVDKFGQRRRSTVWGFLQYTYFREL